MSIRSIPLLTFMPAEIDYCGPAVKAAGYYSSTIGLTTIQIQAMNFQGLLFIEGTNVAVPQATDWFPI